MFNTSDLEHKSNGCFITPKPKKVAKRRDTNESEIAILIFRRFVKCTTSDVFCVHIVPV